MPLSNSNKNHHSILSIGISGGFLSGERLEFADGLNCIIGGRGTGKTTVLEFIRYALGLMPDRGDNKTRAKAIEEIVRGNLGGGVISLEVETRHGTRYRAERPWDDSSQILDENGEPVAVSLDRDMLFKTDVYSQNEIEEIATNPSFQLSLIDKFREEDIRAVNAETVKLKRSIEQGAAELRNLDRSIQDIAEVVPEIGIIEKRLAEMQAVEGPQADRINAAHAHKALRSREKEALESFRRFVSEATDRLERLSSHVGETCARSFGAELLEGPNAAIMRDAADQCAGFARAFHDTLPAIQDRQRQLDHDLDDAMRQLAGIHARQEQEYREMIASSAREQEHAAERARLQQRHLELTTARAELEEMKERRRKLEASHREQTSALSDLRDRRFDMRKQVAGQLSEALAPNIRVSITQSGNRGEYERLLQAALKGSGIQYNRVVGRIVENLSPEELAPIIRKGNTDRLADRAGIRPDLASQIITHLQASEYFFRLETVDLEDEPLIELKDGEDFKNSAGLSTGQRCTVILPILLLESERPLLIDQPEDNLDNAFVYDTIVRNIREAKGGRQLIFVTHNPNIPVLGEAEKVFVFSSDGRHGRVMHSGSVDDVKGEIEHLLEGGEEAFRLRMQKYGH
ncbi:MAG TPA: hypothetical protein ENJ57_06115 [Rhizobiales bacterium]|nr:hypothetical protein [Hyphomicrobiales bacterium]